LLVAAACAALLAPPLRGQTTIGIKGGLSYATLSNKAPNFDARTGFAAGLALDTRAGAIGLQPEVLYVQKGLSNDGAPSASAPKLGYLEVPVLLKLTIPSPGIQPMAYAGPSVSFRLSCAVGDAACPSGTVKSTDWGVVLGAGLRLGGNHGLTVEGRYTWGLQDIHDPGAGVASRTRTFLLLAGVSL
jgi:hypothetical protein